MKSIKISADYWATLTPIEQEYVRQRAAKDGIPYCKLVIKEARKQYPDFTDLFGLGCLISGGTMYQLSGEDTRQFRPKIVTSGPTN